MENIIKSNLPIAEYLVSCWGKNGVVIVNGIAANIQLSINGWTLYSSLVNSTTVTISGSAQIDELRVHPKLAFIKSYAIGVFGITGICDERNTIVYYEYDATGKLARIRDNSNNILKEFEYKYIEQKADWQPNGITRCSPCDIDPSFTTSTLEYAEKDMNPLSASYNQIRWISDGAMPTNCPWGSWQFTNSYRCETYISEGLTKNTGWKERMKKDMNPCSPTFNQTVWVRSHVDLIDCQPTVIFAKFSNVPTSSNSGENYADFIVEFFSDYHCTIPVSVTNLQISYVKTATTFTDRFGWVTTTINQGPVTCNGTGTVLESGYVSAYVVNGDPDPLDPYPILSVGFLCFTGLEAIPYDVSNAGSCIF